MKKFLIPVIILILIIIIGVIIFSNINKEQKQDWEYIESKGELIIGIDHLIPLSYIDEEGKLIGFEIEFAEALTKKIGIKPIFQKIDWDAKEVELNAKNVDCIWSGMSITKERAENMDFTTPYMNSKKVIVTRTADKNKYNSKEDFEGAIVVANIGSQNEKIVQSDPLFSLATYIAVDSQSKSFIEVSTGTADVAVTDYVTSVGSFMKNSSLKNLVIANEIGENNVLAIAFRKNSPETLKVINKAIEELQADGTLKAIAEKYGLGDLVL